MTFLRRDDLWQQYEKRLSENQAQFLQTDDNLEMLVLRLSCAFNVVVDEMPWVLQMRTLRGKIEMVKTLPPRIRLRMMRVMIEKENQASIKSFKDAMRYKLGKWRLKRRTPKKSTLIKLAKKITKDILDEIDSGDKFLLQSRRKKSNDGKEYLIQQWKETMLAWFEEVVQKEIKELSKND